MSNKLLIIIQENIRDKKMNKDCFNKMYIIFISIEFIKKCYTYYTLCSKQDNSASTYNGIL